ncbi:MAG: phosphate signaling complex protein PhoU [Anaerolineales bacterium]
MKTSGLHYTSQLERTILMLRDDVVRMSDLTDTAIARSVTALVNLDVVAASEIIRDDRHINQLRYHIEQKAYQTVATQQPTARDMRALIATIHITVELERIADYAAGIAKIIRQMAQSYVFQPPRELMSMQHITQEMLRGSQDAFINWDEKGAREIFLRDDEVDLLQAQINEKLIALMKADQRNIDCSTYLLWVSHNLERMADRVTNICERTMYMVTGELPPDREQNIG